MIFSLILYILRIYIRLDLSYYNDTKQETRCNNMNNIDFTALSVFDLYDEEMNPVIPFNPRNTNSTRIRSMSDEELAPLPEPPKGE